MTPNPPETKEQESRRIASLADSDLLDDFALFSIRRYEAEEADEYDRLGAVVEPLRLEILSRMLAIQSAISELGGTVEGHPTARHNFLQRIRQLRGLE